MKDIISYKEAIEGLVGQEEAELRALDHLKRICHATNDMGPYDRALSARRTLHNERIKFIAQLFEAEEKEVRHSISAVEHPEDCLAEWRRLCAQDQDGDCCTEAQPTPAFEEQVKLWRTHRNWTQADLAERVGTSQQAVAAIESGCNNPSIRTLVAIADALDVSTDTLLGRSS